jgi:hypothetical protein
MLNQLSYIQMDIVTSKVCGKDLQLLKYGVTPTQSLREAIETDATEFRGGLSNTFTRSMSFARIQKAKT